MVRIVAAVTDPPPEPLPRRALLLVLVVALAPAGCRALQPTPSQGLAPVGSSGSSGATAVWCVLAPIAAGVAVVGLVATADLLVALPVALAEGRQAPFMRWIFGDGPNPFTRFWSWAFSDDPGFRWIPETGR